MINFTAESKKEIKARVFVTKHLLGNYKQCIDDALFQADGYQSFRRDFRYSLIECAYAVYLHCSGNEKAEKYFYKRAAVSGIKRTKASHLSIVVVKILFGFPVESTSTYQYAKALRYACLQKILPEGLAKALKEKGNGIAHMATRFGKLVPTKPRAAESKSARGTVDATLPQRLHGSDDEAKAPEGDDSADQDWDDADAVDTTERNSAEVGGPILLWDPEVLEAWESADLGTLIRLTAKKRRGDQGQIVKVREIGR